MWRGKRRRRRPEKKKSGDGEEEEELNYSDMDFEDFDSEGLAGDAEFKTNEAMEEDEDWEDEKKEIGRK